MTGPSLRTFFRRVVLPLTHGPCEVCGRRWLLGWAWLNINGVCSWRCLDAQGERLLREHFEREARS